MIHYTLQELLNLMPLITICMARTAGMVLFVPVLSGSPVTSRLVKNALILVFSIPIIMHYQGELSFLSIGLAPLALLSAKEFFVGICIGFSAAIPFWAIEIAGSLIDTIRGSTIAELFSVMVKTQTSLLGVLFSLTINVLFLSLGGMDLLLAALYRSYSTLPLLPFNLHISTQLINLFSLNIHLIFMLALSFSLPAILIMLIIDISFGVINVTDKQMNVFSLTMSIKSLLAIFFIIISLNYSIPFYLKHIYHSDQLIYKIVEAIK